MAIKNPVLDGNNNAPSKWSWMMDWCRTNNLPPANSYFWKQAEEAYNKWRLGIAE